MAHWSDNEVERLEEIFKYSTIEELEEAFPDREYDAIRRKAYRLDLERSGKIQRITAVENVEPLDISRLDDRFAEFVSGFVAGEGSFTQSNRPNGTPRFRFCIALANDDCDILYEFRDRIFGCGAINEYGPRRVNEKGNIQYQIGGYGQIVNRVIPFFDEYGFYSARKQEQYDIWRDNVLSEIPDNRKI